MSAVLTWADEHLFEPRSVVEEHELLSAVLARGRGENFDLGTLHGAIEQRGYVREQGTERLTSREVLGCELEIVVAAHDGQGRYGIFAPNHRTNEALSAEQKAAVEKILGSQDFVMLFWAERAQGKVSRLRAKAEGFWGASPEASRINPSLSAI